MYSVFITYGISNIHIAHAISLNSLDEKYSKSVIFWLYENNSVLKTDLQEVVKNLYSLNSLLEKLQEDGLIQIEKKPFGKNITQISLTDKGRRVAEQLKKAQEIAENPDIGNSPIKIEEDAAIRVKELRLLYHVNVMDDHVTIEEVPHGGGRARIFNVYIKMNGHGDFRLWCEQDNSFDCVHAEVAWTYPEVQHMILHYKGKTKVCPYCHTENDSDALFCKHCGARLE